MKKLLNTIIWLLSLFVLFALMFLGLAVAQTIPQEIINRIIGKPWLELAYAEIQRDGQFQVISWLIIPPNLSVITIMHRETLDKWYFLPPDVLEVKEIEWDKLKVLYMRAFPAAKD